MRQHLPEQYIRATDTRDCVDVTAKEPRSLEIYVEETEKQRNFAELKKGGKDQTKDSRSISHRDDSPYAGQIEAINGVKSRKRRRINSLGFHSSSNQSRRIPNSVAERISC